MADTIFYYSDNTTRSSSDAYINQNSRNIYKTLVGIDFGDNVVAIQYGAFSNCTNLNDFILPNNLSYIESSAFSNCTSLTKLILPDSITQIGINLVNGCQNITYIKISNNLTELPYQTFAYCSKLESIIIPNKITHIDDYAFYQCTQLKNIYFLGNSPTFGIGIFYYANINLKLYRKKNFVTGWPDSVQGVPVVLWSDNVIKSGGTGKLTTKKRN